MNRLPLVLMLTACAIAHAADVRATELEGHDSAPSLEQVEARARFAPQSDGAKHWQQRANAAIEFAAMASVLYRDDVALFNARDGIIPYYVLRYLSGATVPPGFGLIALSPNTGSISHGSTSAYLREKGVTTDTLAQGRRLVLLDGSIGWGRTLKRIRQELPPEKQHLVLAHAMMGFGENFGALQRMSALHLWDEAGAGARMPLMHEVDARWENGITFDINPVESYSAGRDGRLLAHAPRASDEQKAAALAWKEHLRHVLDQPESHRLFERRKALWTEARSLLERGDSPALLRWIELQIELHPGSLGEAIARDVTAVALKHHRGTFRWDELEGFSEMAATLAGHRGDASIREPLRRLATALDKTDGKLPPPRDGSLLSHPHTGAVYLVDKGHKWWVPDPEAFKLMRLEPAHIRPTEVSALEQIPDAGHLDLAALGRMPRDGTLLRNPESGAVYLMTAGQKWHVPDPQTMVRMRLHRQPLHQVTSRFLDHIPTRSTPR